ncbi:MAG TPA: NADP-dependent malic enzyme [Pantanalinema sp.]
MKRDALEYHSRGRKGKIEVVATKPCLTQRDLSLAYSPGVAEPCRAIVQDPEAAYEYTARGNLVGVITNGTAVLGLGDIGPLAGKPVMEGKGVLFKRFADLDVFDIEVDEKDPERFIQTVKSLEPTFGGINLEDIKSPECFVIEERLKAEMDIPVFHDDQHGTAIITSAALLNALEITGRKIEEAKVVFCGAGAAAISCARLFVKLGVRRENLVMADKDGVVYRGRTVGMNPYMAELAADTPHRTLAEAMVGADVFVGLSTRGVVTPEMVKTLAPRAVLFALANPEPEITYEEAKAARPDILMGTGRSDYPNQINNVLGFPYIFRGALDVRARSINDEMKLAAAHALADLAKQDVPDQVLAAYSSKHLEYGPSYIIPKPFDPRALLWVAPAVAKAAMETGVARSPIEDFDAYRDSLEKRFGQRRALMRFITNRAKRDPKRIVFPEGDQEKILRAAQIMLDEGIAQPVLLGDPVKIRLVAERLNLTLQGAELVDMHNEPARHRYAQLLFEQRSRKGVTFQDASRLMHQSNYFGTMMLKCGEVDGLVSGLTYDYSETIRPALQIIGPRSDRSIVAGIYVLVFKDRLLFLSDATVNLEPTADQLCEIAVGSAATAGFFGVEPRIAFLSFSNFGSSTHPSALKMKRATELTKDMLPTVVVDGEMQADTAVHPPSADPFTFSAIQGDANVLIFPDLQSCNIAYKLLHRMGGAEAAVGPILMGMAKPVNVLQHGADVDEIVNVTAITVSEAQRFPL